ncbi:MAG: FAD-binding oxidoreductase, partial [Planctomycetes bacterium]|nr:FAD-binding oxidoreductase [Planctomycetota bacterium]
KVGTDMAVPDEKLREVFAMYREGLEKAGLASVVFGHIGNNHVHVNILPADLDELKKAKELYLDWAPKVVEMGGAVAAEHGIGRIKKAMLEVQYPAETLDAMRNIRAAFDPKGTLAPGVLV